MSCDDRPHLMDIDDLALKAHWIEAIDSAAKFRKALGVRRMNWRSKNRTRERKWAHLNDRMLKNMPKALVAIASDRRVWERRSIVGVTACSYPCETSHFDPDVRITASAAEAAVFVPVPVDDNIFATVGDHL